MNPLETIVGAVEIIAASLLFFIPNLKGNPMSEAFKAALANLVAAFTAKIAEKQTELDAANARIAELEAAPVVTDTGPQVDAEDTAAVIAATPA